MLRDVFYFGKKPNVHPREKFAVDLVDARSQSTTEHFWIINEFCDYKNFDWDFDFEFLPDEDVWAEDHINVWPSYHQKDSGTWLCNTDNTNPLVVYRADVEPLKRKNEKTDHWVFHDKVDESKFDFSWHPDPTEPPYIYKWGCKFYPVEFKTCLEYRVPGATEVKYMTEIVELLPNWDLIVEHEKIDYDKFDMSWRPDPRDPPFIYVWGNKWVDGKVKPTLEYHAPGGTERKYMNEIITLLPEPEKFQHLEKADGIDYSWVPDPTSPPYIYAWGNQWNKPEDKVSIQYVVEGATEYKYMEERATRKPCMDNWEVPPNVDVSEFDFSWEPSPAEPPYIYQFGTQHQRTGGPRYIVKGATEVKYIDTLKAKALPSSANWEIPTNIDIAEFDFSWHPDDTDPPYIYIFGTQWALTGGPRYIVPNATEKKYIDNIIAKAAPNREHWVVPDDIDIDAFDFSWHPYAEDDPFIYQFGTQWQKTGGPKFIAPGADETSFVKYIDTRIIKAKKLPNKTNWIVPKNVDESSVDFSWHPDDTEPAYIYKFGTQWHDRGGPEYHVPGATAIKYSSDIKGKTKPVYSSWKINIPIEEDKFDFSWVPHPDDPPYIYVFGNQWNGPELESTVEYIVAGATERKYVHDIVAIVSPDKTRWTLLEEIESFDYSWRPNPTDPAYIYVFGSKQYPGTIMPVVELRIDGATEYKYVEDIVATLKQKPELFSDIELIESFDYSWRPNPKDPPYVYQFGTQWAKTHGPRFVVEGATEVKYVEDTKAIIKPNMANWEIPDNVNVSTFDFSWHPDANAPKYIYQFGTIEDPNDGPRYVTSDNTGEVVNIERVERLNDSNRVYPKYYITTTLEDLINEHPTEIFWALRDTIDYTEFDFSWKPDIQQASYIHAFGSSESPTTQTYFVNSSMYLKGFRDINYVNDQALDEEALAKLFKKPAMFFVDRGNQEAQARFEQLKVKFPTIQKTRFLNTWVDTINRCINRSTTNLCWILNSELDYSRFDFNYYPNPWQMKMVHVFGTQWSHWGTTFMVNRDTFAEDTKYIKIIEHLSNLNFVKTRRAYATNRLYDVYIVDHGNGVAPELSDGLNAKIISYKNSYFETFKELLNQLPEKKDHYIWVCSSICDYQGFDFTYICDPFARDQLHVFPSNGQKFGDTFLVNVNKLRELISDMTKLEDYVKINYNGHMKAKRLAAPTVITEGDTHVSAIHTEFNWPYATFVTEDNKDIQVIDTEPLNLWSPETKAIQITSTGGTRIVVPREAKEHIKRELYDYPYIITNSKLAKSTPLDIVFLSNGETGADENYEHLLRTTHGLSNRVVRVDGINGRVQAYHAAAEASNTPWMFTVFAKLKVSNKFDWNWQPDRLQLPKHYVFYAKNPVNGLVYGHQAMIAYNKKLTLANEGKGLDFTQDDEHEVLEINSGTAMFNTDEWSTWRTAFREALKLRNDTTEISKERLTAWLTIGNGDFAQYSLDGARHAVEYYDAVNGDFEKLKLSYDWPWLKAYYESKYR